MDKKQAKDLEDANSAAFNVLQHVIKTTEGTAPAKNPAAVALGKLGASKGGKARAASLSSSKRKKIAREAAKARWHDKKK
ncbi:MAG TPA: hypothetical protein VFB27_06720 [Opitutaceae bacterium]|nr:hypothetical protein [Opitutaceae bacterium]